VSHRVEWVDEAVNNLAAAWTGAADREAVSVAAAAIDAELAADPLGVGESRAGPNRILIRPPLTAYYRVEADGAVVVYDLRVNRPRRR
jgi:plasmid stabilization system protein ParE